jgi:hypothetical protein
MSNKDNTLKEVVVVYHSMNEETKRFIAGEIEADAAVAEELVRNRFSLDVTFRSEADIQIETGVPYVPNFKPFTVGLDYNDNNVMLYDIQSFVATEIVPNGINGSYKVYIDKFYNQLSVFNELKELDKDKNLEIKIDLIKRAEQLKDEPNIRKALLQLNKYHEDWKNTGPVRAEISDDIWKRFKAASDIVIDAKKAEQAQNK